MPEIFIDWDETDAPYSVFSELDQFLSNATVILRWVLVQNDRFDLCNYIFVNHFKTNNSLSLLDIIYHIWIGLNWKL